MVMPDKLNLQKDDIKKKIRDKLAQKLKFKDIEFEIFAIPENILGQNFRIDVTNEREIGELALTEAKDEVFAPVLSQFSLRV